MNKLILSAVLALTASAAAAETVRMGTEGAYPPWNYIDDNGEVAGFERELGDELCKRAGLECEWVTNDWDSIIPNLVSGNYDTIMAGMAITPERAEVISFTQGYTQPDPSSYVALSADVDVANGVIAGQTNTIQAAYIAENHGALLEYAVPEECVAAVRAGEADAVLADKSFLDPIVAESGGELVEIGSVLIGGGVGMGLRQSDTELKAKFDAAIQSMKEDGSLNALIEEYGVSEPF